MNDLIFESDNFADDKVLCKALKSGDRKAFEAIYRKYSKTLLRYGNGLTIEQQIVQDCIQDLFIELWEGRERQTEIESLKFYLLKSVRYKIMRQLRNSLLEVLTESETYIESENVEVQRVREETMIHQSRKLSAAIELLPKRQKEAINLRYLQELSNEEVARIMGVNYQSACKFIYTALKSLKEVMLLLVTLVSIGKGY